MKKIFFLFMTFLSLIGCYDIASMSAQQDNSGPIEYKTVWPWDSQTIYTVGDLATMPQIVEGKSPMYKSLRYGNQGIEPPTAIVQDDSCFGTPGDQLPDYTPAPDWADWWIRIR